jgi:sialic acid synthase SpsE
MKTVTIGSKEIGEDKPCFIIAEAGVNHDRDIEKAKRLVDIAKEAGADAVKFQTWITEDILMQETQKAAYQQEQTGADETQFEMVKKLELSFDQFRELAQYCEQQGILFLSTPDDKRSAKFLFDLGIPAFKIGSGELNNPLYLRYLTRFGRPLILSTGMGTMAEVRRAVDTILETGNNGLVVLHCTTDYPTPLKDANLKVIKSMKRLFEQRGVLIGYSDHTEGTEVPVIARGLGAVLIEKHFTYDRNAPGPDHKASLAPEELKALVRRLRELDLMSERKRFVTAKALPNFTLIAGSSTKRPTEREMANRKVIRRALVSGQLIKAGTVITEEMVLMKRANGKGVPANRYEKIVGKTAKKNIPENTLFTTTMVQ